MSEWWIKLLSGVCVGSLAFTLPMLGRLTLDALERHILQGRK